MKKDTIKETNKELQNNNANVVIDTSTTTCTTIHKNEETSNCIDSSTSSNTDAMFFTAEMKAAIENIENDPYPLFITGKAGTGKTTFLKRLANRYDGEIVITASTGVAAINAGGCTIHSLLRIPIRPISPYEMVDTEKNMVNKSKQRLIRNMRILVIDEVSMISPGVLDYINTALKFYCRDNRPFGGKKVIFFGDLFQLPPVVTASDKEIMSRYYSCPYFFNAYVFKSVHMKIIEFTEIFRQKEPEFINMLNRIRQYTVINEDLNMLNSRVGIKHEEAITICGTKREVEKINSDKLNELPGKLYSFPAKYDGNFKKDDVIVPEVLEVKVGSRVMSVINDPDKRYVNGSLGNVLSIKNKIITVEFDNGNICDIEKHSWSKNDYKVDEDDNIIAERVGGCVAYPLILGDSITIHKSQGITVDKCTISNKFIFVESQLYVALSRCRSLEGISLSNIVYPNQIIRNEVVLMFDEIAKKHGVWKLQ